MDQEIFSCLDMLYEDRSIDERKTIVHMLQTLLLNLQTSFFQILNELESPLTPTEIKIINYIRYGKTTKEIANSMYVSTKTIKTHRQNIRRKLGISGKKIDLMSYLRSLM